MEMNPFVLISGFDLSQFSSSVDFPHPIGAVKM
jgi:hypothetical protein